MKQAITEVNGISITKNLIGINYTKGIFIKPKYIVIHDISDNRFTTMREYRNYIAREKDAKESIHYLVGPRNVIKLLEDDWRGWHVGDKPSKEVTNSNSISVAMFIRDSKDISRTLKNVIVLVNKLRGIYGIGINNVKRHYDVTGKICPELLVNEKAWNRFKLALKGIESELTPIAKGKIIGVLSSLNLRKEPTGDQSVTQELVDAMNAAGYRPEVVSAYQTAGGAPYLDYTDTVLGQVYEGMDVVDAIGQTGVDENQKPTEEITINSVTIETYQ